MCCVHLLAQENSIEIKARLDVNDDLIHIDQKIIYFNTSTSSISELYLHNWGNSFTDNNTPLAKRFIEDYKNDFYFSKDQDKGFSYIKNVTVNNKRVVFKEKKSILILLK